MICNFMIFSESVGSGASLSANNLKLSAKRWAFFVQAVSFKLFARALRRGGRDVAHKVRQIPESERDSPRLSPDYLPQPFCRQIFYANRKRPDAYRMHSGWPFSLHTPFPDRWGFEPSIDYQLLPGRKPGVFTDVYGFAQGK